MDGEKVAIVFIVMMFGSLMASNCNDSKEKDQRIEWLQNQLDTCMETRK